MLILKSKKTDDLNTSAQMKLLLNTKISQIDIYTGRVVTGARGESIIVGGLNIFTGMVGYSNNYKSTIMHFLVLSAADTLAASVIGIRLSLYDTENNVIVERLDALAMKHRYLYSNTDDMFYSEEPTWFVTDKANILADDYINGTVAYLKEQAKDKNNMIEFSCFTNKLTKKPLRVMKPSFYGIDSLSEMETKGKFTTLEKEDLDDGKTVFMADGLAKTKFLARIPTIAKQYGAYFAMTAHLGEKIDMDGKYEAKASKKLQHLNPKDKIKGGTDKLIYLSSISYHAGNTSLLQHRESKLPLFPESKDDTIEKDLNVVPLTVLRNKTGTSGQKIRIVVSQTQGVLPELTNFLNVKESGKGIGGNDRNYHLELMPDVTLSRTTVRGKLRENDKLVTATKLTADLINAERYMPFLKVDGLICSADELYEDIKKMGYDWNEIYDCRTWYTADQYSKDLPNYISIVDLLKMRKGLYHPYWLEKDSKKYRNPFLDKGSKIAA